MDLRKSDRDNLLGKRVRQHGSRWYAGCLRSGCGRRFRASLGSITPSSTTFADVTTGAATATATTETLEFCGTVLGDHTVFLDNVRQNNPIIADPGFESPSVATYSYGPIISGSSWTFGGNAGIEHNGSAFGAANAPQGTQAAFLQRAGGCVSRAVSGWTAGTHSVTMQVAQRGGSLGGQTLQVFLDAVQAN